MPYVEEFNKLVLGFRNIFVKGDDLTIIIIPALHGQWAEWHYLGRFICDIPFDQPA